MIKKLIVVFQIIVLALSIFTLAYAGDDDIPRRGSPLKENINTEFYTYNKL